LLELVVRFCEVFFADFPAAPLLPETDLFLVTLLPTSFRFDAGVPGRRALLPPIFPFADFALARLLELPVAILLEVALLGAAFFFGIR
jgi:hypothetical protein